jgi:hypothetical protein
VLELGATRNLPFDERLLHYALSAITLAGSWLFLNTMFTLHYARLFYRSDERSRPLRFPEGERVDPNYWDFLYFAFTRRSPPSKAVWASCGRGLRLPILAFRPISDFLHRQALPDSRCQRVCPGSHGELRKPESPLPFCGRECF